MSKLADPTICPDCRAALDAGATCPGCGLVLTGPAGQRLWQVMLGADRIVEEIRATTAIRVPAPAQAGPVVTRGLPPAPPAAAGVRRARVPAASVPAVLLSLGALCLLVAATVFVAIAWGSLGLTGRTVVLTGVTATLATAATLLTRRRLRGAAESLWTIVAGMVTLDLLAGRAAGLVGLRALDWQATAVLVGGTLLALGVGVTLWARRTTATDLWAPQVVAVLGALGATAGGAWLADDPSVATALAVPVLVVVGTLLLRRLTEVSSVLLGLAAVTWLELVALGLGRASEVATWAEWWSDVRGWPLLVAAGYAAIAAGVGRVPGGLRSVLAAAAIVPLAVLANAPVTPGTPTRDTVVRVLTLGVLALLTRAGSRVWARAAAALGVVAGLAMAAQLAWQPWTAVDLLPARAHPSLPMPAVAYAAAPWAWVVVGVGLALAALVAARTFSGWHADVGRAVALVAVPAGAAVAASAAHLPLWAVVSAVVGCAVGVAGATWWRRNAWSPAGVAVGTAGAGYLLLVGLAAAVPSSLLTAVAGSTVAVLLVVGLTAGQRRDEVVAPALTGGTAVLAITYALPGWASLWSVSSRTTAVATAVLAVLVALAAAPVSRRTTTRLTLELSALVPALAAAALAPDPASLAVVLTVVGSGIACLSVLNHDRGSLAWVASGVLASATALRVVLEVRAPEIYTLPAAGLLVAAGLWRMRADRDADSFGSLGAGLALALVPSLLLALQAPVSLRGVLVGAGGAAALALGARQRMSAPLLAGAITVALLAVRELEPVAGAVPRWVSLAALGMALLAAGITWESRLRNLRAAGRYLTALR